MQTNDEPKSTHGRLRRPVRASIGFTLTGLVARGIGILTTPYLTRLLSPAQYGLYPLYTARLSLVSVFASCHLYGGVFLRGMQRAPKEGRDAFVRRAVLSSLVPFSLTLAVCILLHGVWNDALLRSPLLLTVLFLQIAINTLLSFFTAKCRFLYRALPHAIVTLAVAIGSPLVTFLLLRSTTLGGLSRIVAPAAVGATVALPVLVHLLRAPKSCADVPTVGALLLACLPLLPYSLSLTAVDEVGRLILGQTAGVDVLGKFGVASALATAPLLLTSGIQAVLQPWMQRKLVCGQTALIARTLRLFCLLTAAATVVLSLVAPEVFALLAPEGYRDALVCVVPITLSVLPHMLFVLFAGVSTFLDRARSVTGAAVFAACAACSLSVLLIPRYGLLAAAVMTAISYLLLCLLQYAVLRRARAARMVSLPYTVGVYLASCVLCAASVALYAHPLLRIPLAALVLLACALCAWRARGLLLEETAS